MFPNDPDVFGKRYIYDCVLQCAKYCLESTKFVCQSFSYNSNTRECFLSAVNSKSHKTKPARHETFYELAPQHGMGVFDVYLAECIN